MKHKSGFVNIVGFPNVGKSTLMNALIGDRLSIITSKPQTTRHRILGIYNDDDHQIVFSDTPGIIRDPSYEMQSAMNSFAYSSLEDADLLILLTDPFDNYTGEDRLIQSLQKRNFPVFLIINKIDLRDDSVIDEVENHWKEILEVDRVFRISATEKTGIEELLEAIKSTLPDNPPYYPKDQLSDKNMRFFVSEIIREKILEQFSQEIPYSCEVIVDEYLDKEEKDLTITKIYTSIYVSRKSQKSILIGKGGSAIKKLGIAARQEIEAFIGDKIFLELKIKIKENWRNDDRLLKHFGYK